MKKINTLITLIFLLNTFISLGYWSEVPTPTTEDLNKIEVINGTAFCVGNNGTLLKSSNLGDTWSAISTGATGNLTAIKFTNSSNGYFTTSNGKVYKSTNGGTSWSSKSVHDGGLNTIDFLDNLTGITAGDNGVLYKTLDGGNSWTSLGSQSIYAINDLTFINDTLVVAVGPNGSVLYSGDIGESWTYLTTGTNEVLSAIEKKDNETGVIVGSNGSYTEFNASDLSVNNITKLDNNEHWLKDVHVNEKSYGYNRTVVVGFSSSYYIENNGWKEWDLDSSNNFTGIHYFNDTVGVICGHHGKIYKTISEGVPHSITKVFKEDIKIYPNPVISSISLDDKFKNSFVSIYSFESKIVLQKKVVGNKLDVSSLPKGVYFIRNYIKNEIHTGKFIKK